MYDPESCCSIGPELVTHHLLQRCASNLTDHHQFDQPDTTVAEATQTTTTRTRRTQAFNGHSSLGQECMGTTVFPATLFYPIHYGYGEGELKSIFTEGAGLGPTFFSNNKAFTLHHYNSLSARALVSPDGDSILREAFRRNCPLIFQVLHEAHVFF